MSSTNEEDPFLEVQQYALTISPLFPNSQTTVNPKH